MESKMMQGPVKLTLEIPGESLAKIVDSGRLTEFADALASLAAAHIQHEIVESATRGTAANGIALKLGFDDDNRYGTGPHPWPWPHRIFDAAMRYVAERELAQRYMNR